MTASTGERMTQPAQQQPPPAVHPAWRHAAELGPVSTGAVFAAGAVLYMAHVPVLVLAVVAGAAAASSGLAAVLIAKSWPASTWFVAAGCCATGWTAYAGVAGPWSWPAVTALFACAAALTPLWPAVRAHETRLEEAERRRLAALEGADGARKWPAYLARIGVKGVQYISREDTRSGYKLRLRLPATGKVTIDTLAGAVDRLEVAARARRGTLRFEHLAGDPAHEVLLHVSERDFLAETIRLPVDNRTMSINNPIPVGLYEDGAVCTLLLREIAVLIIGLRGSGKSNLLNVLIAQLARCVDVVIWVIDLKGGRMARPWLEPWLTARTPRPVIDWLATTREEADLMLDAALRGVEVRNSRSSGEKTVPSVREPAIMLIVDEMAVLFGQNMGGPPPGPNAVTNVKLARKGKQLTILGRSAAIDPVFASQRGAVTMTGDGDLKSQCETRIGLGVATEADARLVIPDNIHIAADLAKLRHAGTGIVQVKDGRAVPVKFYRIEQEDIGAIAALTGHWRPAPDKMLADALGADYAARWTERGSYLVPAVPARGGSVVAPPGVEQDEFESIVNANLADIDKPVSAITADDVPAAHRRMRAYIQRMGRGVTVKAIVQLLASEKMPVSRSTVHRWLNEDAARGLIEQERFGSWKWL